MMIYTLSYIDPNTGGLIFTWLAASLALLSGSVLFLASHIKVGAARVKRYLRERFKGKTDQPSDQEPSPSRDAPRDES